jgi:hypothetical protein
MKAQCSQSLCQIGRVRGYADNLTFVSSLVLEDTHTHFLYIGQDMRLPTISGVYVCVWCVCVSPYKYMHCMF